MCSTTIEAGSKWSCVNNGGQTKGSINRKFALANLLQVTKSASGCIVNKFIGTGMTKSVSGDKRKCLTEIKETISTEMAVVTTAQGKVVAITYLSIRLSFILSKKREHRFSLSLPSFLFPSSPSSTKRKVEIGFVGIEMSVLVFLFGVPSIAKPDKFLKY